jgi:hypothetical protein
MRYEVGDGYRIRFWHDLLWEPAHEGKFSEIV